MRHLLPLAILALSGCATPQGATPLPSPGSAYAWITFDAAGQRGGGAAGLADRAQSRQLTLDDPVRVASVSKLVVALGVMRLVEQRRLDLDEDVSGRLGWSLRNPAHPQVPITLRMLLSHTSGLKDEGDNYVIPLGTTVRQMTDRPEAFDAEHVPGRFFRYSNLNYPVIASVMERATGERFDRLIHRLVLKPLALDACFNWTMCSDARLARAVVLYRPDGTVARDDLGGRQPGCPVATSGPGCDLDTYVLGSNGALFSPQGGLRASVRDLAVIGRLLLNSGRHGGQPFLTEASVADMLRPAWTFDGSNGDTSGGFYCAYGLGTQTLPAAQSGCRDNLFGSGRIAAGHAGEAYGLRSGLWIDPKRRVGIAFFAANNPSPEPPSRTAYSAAEEWLAAKLPR
jgi:CubicO group peptidase (beta-lactamase class C family)